ncbi:MAG: HNH endonuclease signature motif containing protein [Clostridia bacterium]|nr:HNH endonuclease signature motif containing protein [Tissierellia bacterium]MDD4376309.1 HNH endonuclease signature motif containing protein [Clostridia bacterium]
MAKVKDNILKFEDTEKIVEYLEDKSSDMVTYIEKNNNSKYTLIRKFITHSDLATFGKRNGFEQTIEKNYLYYLSTDEMKSIEEREGKEFETAKQSNITVPSSFYEKLGIQQLRRRDGLQDQHHTHILINNYANVYLVNQTIDYFTPEYTFKVFEKLNKNVGWTKEECTVTKSDVLFTPIELRHAIHGIGTSADLEFHKIRHNIFKNDSLILIIEEKIDNTKNLYILLDKNPSFFSIVNETNKAYENYLIKGKRILELYTKEMVEDEKTRRYQNSWRESLAEEMMNYTTIEGNVFCPLTYIEGSFDNIGTLYRASHIKRYSDSEVEEAFDINNGLLLVANADALFDKHLITINEDKELIFSFLLEYESKLKAQLQLTIPIFKMVLNEKRMEYLKEHRKIFLEKEEQRKK